MPQFGDFIMEPSVVNKDYISLDWKEKGSDFIFGVNQISDGTLRFMALATLLLQPPKTMPSLIVIDEPELGLHPKAISLLAGLIKKASENAQIVLATQSPNLLDEFDADKVVGSIGVENNIGLLVGSVVTAVGTAFVVNGAAAHAEGVGHIGSHIPASRHSVDDIRPQRGVARAADAAHIDIIVGASC